MYTAYDEKCSVCRWNGGGGDYYGLASMFCDHPLGKKLTGDSDLRWAQVDARCDRDFCGPNGDLCEPTAL